MQKRYLSSTKVRFALQVMVLLYFLSTCFCFINHPFSLQTFKKLPAERNIFQISEQSVLKELSTPLKVGEATPSNASSSGLVNELELLLAAPLLLLIWAFFFFPRLSDNLFQKPVEHLPFLHLYPIFPNAP